MEMQKLAKSMPLLKIEPYSINVQAHYDPDSLGFPVIITGSRVRIPKDGFLFFMRHGKLQLEPPAHWLETLKAECLRQTTVSI